MPNQKPQGLKTETEHCYFSQPPTALTSHANTAHAMDLRQHHGPAHQPTPLQRSKNGCRRPKMGQTSLNQYRRAEVKASLQDLKEATAARGTEQDSQEKVFNCNEIGQAAKDCPHYNPRQDGPRANVIALETPEPAWSMVVDDKQTNHDHTWAATQKPWTSNTKMHTTTTTPTEFYTTGPRHVAHDATNDPTPAKPLENPTTPNKHATIVPVRVQEEQDSAQLAKTNTKDASEIESAS